MKIFEKMERWEEKVNFVDENNVLVGYDMGQDCCEYADWFIADQPTEKVVERKETPDMEGWVFDPSYFREVESADEFDDGGMVIFRLVNGDQEKFLHLFNSHNGYYGHGCRCNIPILQKLR